MLIKQRGAKEKVLLSKWLHAKANNVLRPVNNPLRRWFFAEQALNHSG